MKFIYCAEDVLFRLLLLYIENSENSRQVRKQIQDYNKMYMFLTSSTLKIFIKEKR